MSIEFSQFQVPMWLVWPIVGSTPFVIIFYIQHRAHQSAMNRRNRTAATTVQPVSSEVGPPENATHLRPLALALGTAANGQGFFDVSERGWGKLYHHLNLPIQTNALQVLQIWWFNSIKPKLEYAAKSGESDVVKDAVTSLNQFKIQLIWFYRDIFDSVWAIDPQDHLNLLGYFHSAYSEIIEPVETAIIPIQSEYSLAWEHVGKIHEKHKELLAEAHKNQKELMKSLITLPPPPSR